MGKRHRSTGRDRGQNQSSYDDLETELLAPRRAVSPLRPGGAVRRFRDIEDRRNWAPAGPAEKPRVAGREVAGRKARIVHAATSTRPPRRPVGNPLGRWHVNVQPVTHETFRFADARRTVICLKRKVRAQVLHALKRTRSGKGSPKKRTPWSDIKC